MLFQPTNVIPNTLSGEGNGTVDVTEPLTVSWQVNGNSPMVAYRIKIMQNDTDSTLKLDTGKVTLSTPFYGNDAFGNPKAYSVNISSSQMSTAGIINGYSNGYKMTIQQWWNANDSVEQTSASFFITRALPTVTMQIIPYSSSFRQQDHTFEAFYSQAQGDAIEWARWELQAIENGRYVTVDDTGYVYHPGVTQNYYSDTLSYHYNGFCIGTTSAAPGIQYRVRCTVQTENGVQGGTGWKEFTTVGLGAEGTAPIELCTARDRDAVRISFPKNFPLLGIASGNYSYESGTNKFQLNLPDGSSVQWGNGTDDSLKIQEPNHTIFVKGIIKDALLNSHVFFRAMYGEKELTFSYSNGGFAIQYDGNLLWENTVVPVADAVFGIALLNESVYFLMKNGSTIIDSNDAIVAWQQGEMQSISIYGPMVFTYVFVKTGNILYSYFYFAIASDYYGTELDKDYQFLAVFDNTLYTGPTSIGASGTGRNGNPPQMTNTIAIYRKEKGKTLFHLISDVPLNSETHNVVIYDGSAKNATEYEYYFLYLWDSKYTRSRGEIGKITPCRWEYTVLCCSQNNIGDYIVESEYRFGLNIASGSMGNNNNPVLQQNFTRYPLRQPLSQNFKSGTLSAYIGKVENDQYVDTVDLMEELYALSTNRQTKFLKTRKGQIFQIETSSPVSMQIADQYVPQPAKISLPWVEVGNASSANILGDTSFALGTPTFSVDPETMELTMEYSNSSAMGADSFALVDSDLYLMNPGVYDESDFSLNDSREVILNTD